LRASLIVRADGRVVDSKLTDVSGYAVFVVVHDEVTTGIPSSEVYQDYKITIVDPDGVFSPMEFQPLLASSDADFTVTITRK